MDCLRLTTAHPLDTSRKEMIPAEGTAGEAYFTVQALPGDIPGVTPGSGGGVSYVHNPQAAPQGIYFVGGGR
jgi:hypothetical protein